MTEPEMLASVRYLVDDVGAAMTFYTTHFGFTVHTRAIPVDAAPAGRNRIRLVVDDLDTEIDRIRRVGLSFRSDVLTGPGGRQILLADPARNLVELSEPARQ